MARRHRRSRSALALRWLAAAVLAVIAFGYVQPLRAYHEARGEEAEKRERIVELERRQAALARRLEVAGTDDFVVREARRLGLVRPGERLFIVKGIERWRKGGLR